MNLVGCLVCEDIEALRVVPVACLLKDVEAPELLAGVSHHLLARAPALVQSHMESSDSMSSAVNNSTSLASGGTTTNTTASINVVLLTMLQGARHSPLSALDDWTSLICFV
jgi:hypothetical protein